MAKVGELRRGDLVYVDNENAVGAEIKKSRPAVVISSAKVCEFSPIVQIAYVSHSEKKAMDLKPYHVVTPGNRTILCEQIYTVDLSRIERLHMVVSPETMVKVDEAIARQFQLDALFSGHYEGAIA